MSQVRSGILLAAKWLLGMAWLGLVVGGMAVAFTPSPHSPALGWVLLAVAALIAILTMNRWVKVFPALLAVGTFNGFITIFSGHLINLPSKPISRPDAVALTLFAAVSTGVSITIARRRLCAIDRIALFAFLVYFFWQALDNRVTFIGGALALSCLVVAWAVDRLRHGRPPERASTSQSGATV